MSYQEFQPHPVLRPYIDAYWVMKSKRNTPEVQRIYPDGCIDIILNFGGEFLTHNGTFQMKNEGAYLVGTMTRYIDIIRQADTYLLGIRFKPLGFPVFYQFSSLHEVTNKTIEFNRKLTPEVYTYDSDTVTQLDKYFGENLTRHEHPLALAKVMETMKKENGNISMDRIAKQHCITGRQLERHFRRYLGISPKEYANFIRYQFALQFIKQKTSEENLLDVALDLGYYDHAHLTNEIKKYAGFPPSQLKMSDFSK